MANDEAPRQPDDVQRLWDRIRELQQTQERLMRELQKSLDATAELLKQAKDRRQE